MLEICWGQTHEIEINSSNTIKEVKDKLIDKFNVQPSEQSLIFSGKKMDDDHTVQEYYIQSESTIHLVTVRKENIMANAISLWKQG